MKTSVTKFVLEISAKPECIDFLKIRMPDENYLPVDEFTRIHPYHEKDIWNSCKLNYRGEEIAYQGYNDRQRALSEQMRFVDSISSAFLVDNDIRAAAYFFNRAAEWLQFARFFIMKSSDWISDDVGYNTIGMGYIPHFQSRCIYFGTAATWLSNSFDQILQTVYWGHHLYTETKDRKGNKYDETWDKKKILENCTFEFVVGELKKRGLTDCRNHITQCSALIEDVRKWANYIKHKGGIDYKYLEPELDSIIMVTSKDGDIHVSDDFKSPVQIDIDLDMQKLIDAHKALFDCINDIKSDIEFDKHELHYGG